MPEKPTLFVCHGDDGGARFHPAGAFKKRFERQVSNIRKSSPHMGVRFRSCAEPPAISLFAATGTRELPTLKLPDVSIISHSRAILAWVREQREREDALKRVA